MAGSITFGVISTVGMRKAGSGPVTLVLQLAANGCLHSLSNPAITTSSAFQRLNVDEFSFPDAFIVFSEPGETPEKGRRENWQRKMALNYWFPWACISQVLGPWPARKVPCQLSYIPLPLF